MNVSHHDLALMFLSARNPKALDNLIRETHQRFDENPNYRCHDVMFTLMEGRERYDYSAYYFLHSERIGEQHHQAVLTKTKAKKGKLFLLFPKQSQPMTVAHDNEHLALCQSILGHDLEPDSELTTFCHQYATVKQLQDQGLQFHGCLGEGVGEYLAALFCGVFSLETALLLLKYQSEGDLIRFEELLHGDHYQEAQRQWSSSITTDIIETIPSPGHWVTQEKLPSLFNMALTKLGDRDNYMFLNVVPSGVLGHTGEALSQNGRCIPLEGDVLEVLAQLYALGGFVDWQCYFSNQKVRRVSLPSHPFHRVHTWYGKNQCSPPVVPIQKQKFQEVTQEVAQEVAQEPVANTTPSQNERPDIGIPYEAPADQVEQALVAFSGEHLGYDALGVLDNVTQLGADSLFTMQLSQWIEKVFSIEITPHHLFPEPHLRGLGNQIKQRCPNAIALASQTLSQKSPPPPPPPKESLTTPTAAANQTLDPQLQQMLQALEFIEQFSDQEANEMLSSFKLGASDA